MLLPPTNPSPPPSSRYLPNALMHLLSSLRSDFKPIMLIPSYNQVLEDSCLQAPLSLFKDSSQLSFVTNPNLSSRITSSIVVVAHISGVLMTQLLGFKPLQLLTSLKVECRVPTTTTFMCYSASAWAMMCNSMKFHCYCYNACQSCPQCSKTFNKKNPIEHQIEETKLSFFFPPLLFI